MTNQSPESVIAEALRRTKMSLSEPLWSEVRAEQAGHIEAALRAANMLRESGVPDAATAAIERARVEVESINQAAQKSLCGSEPDHAGIYEGAARALAALDGAPEPAGLPVEGESKP